jgi:malate dehydrogenase (oxaloacetate-decarboxylating)(NADP+)
VARYFGDEPVVAMLSESDFGEAREESVGRIRKAVQFVRALQPDLQIDGEMQADTAVDPVKAREGFPFSDVAGRANVLIFPNITSGNITYKLLRELGGAVALGPILVGLGKPVNVLAMGSTVSDIVNMAAITVNQVGTVQRSES